MFKVKRNIVLLLFFFFEHLLRVINIYRDSLYWLHSIKGLYLAQRQILY